MKTLADVLNHKKTYRIDREYTLDGVSKFRTTEIGWLEGIAKMSKEFVKLLTTLNFQQVGESFICIHDMMDASVKDVLELNDKVIQHDLSRYIKAYMHNYINGDAKLINSGFFESTLVDMEILKHVSGDGGQLTDCSLVISFAMKDYFEIKQYNHETKDTTVHKVNEPLSREALWDFKIGNCRAAFLWDLYMDQTLLDDYKRSKEISRGARRTPEEKLMRKAVKELQELTIGEKLSDEYILKRAFYIASSPELNLIWRNEI